MLISRQHSQFLLVDLQAKLVPHIHESERLIQNCRLLMEGAGMAEVPLTICEQYPAGLGTTVPELRCLAEADGLYSKMTFSAARDPALRQRLLEGERRQMILCGIEAHVCVLQTALDLLDEGLQIFVVADAISSRAPESKIHALERIRQAGAIVVTSEMVIFEWAERAGTDLFRGLSKMVR